EQPDRLEREQDLHSDEGASDEDLRMREVDELEHAVHHRVPERDERIHEAEDETIQEDLREDADQECPVHRPSFLEERSAGGAGERPSCEGSDRSAAYFFASGAAMVSCLTILLSPHFWGSSLVTCSTKYWAFWRSPLLSKAISPVMPESLALRTAAETASRLRLPALAASSTARSAMDAASYDSAA